MTTTDFLTGTVKGPGEMPHEYLFITKDNNKTRIGEFVYYAAKIGDEITANYRHDQIAQT
ncbi:MAG: hypothetical protein WKF71_11870 [Pyrinomonadaceae bacterium]